MTLQNEGCVFVYICCDGDTEEMIIRAAKKLTWGLFYLIFWLLKTVTCSPKLVLNLLSSRGWSWTSDFLLLFSKCWALGVCHQIWFTVCCSNSKLKKLYGSQASPENKLPQYQISSPHHPSAMKTKQLACRLFVQHPICSAFVLACPTKCCVEAEEILDSGSWLTLCFFSSRPTSTPPSYLLFLWFSDCVGFCQIEQTKPVEKTPQKTGHADSGWGANATRSLNHLSKALIYGENKRQLFNTEQEESALGTDKRRKMPDSFWIWT